MTYKATGPDVAVGTVLGESPQWNLKYTFGTKVTLTVAKGAQDVRVPSKGVVGQTVSIARDALAIEGFVVSSGTPQFSSRVPMGNVVNTDPVPGSLEPPGSTVYIIISEGPAATVPDVVLDTQAQAIRALKHAGLRVSVNLVDTPGYLPGYVTAPQFPAAGTQEKPGYVMTIDVEQPTSPTSTSTSTIHDYIHDFDNFHDHDHAPVHFLTSGEAVCGASG